MRDRADVYSLMNRLRKCPLEFLQPSRLMGNGTVHTGALTMDLYRKIWGFPLVLNSDLPSVDSFQSFSDNLLVCTHLACWFFFDGLFLNAAERVPQVHLFITNDLPELSNHVPFQKFIDDEERTEEFVRMALARCNLLPLNETEAEAANKFKAISTVARLKVLKETQQALERVKAIKKKMEDDKAREAANVYGRE